MHCHTMSASRPEDAAGNAEHAGNEHDAAVAIPPPARVSAGAHVSSMAQYRAMYERSLASPTEFWGEAAREHLSWFRDFTEV